MIGQTVLFNESPAWQSELMLMENFCRDGVPDEERIGSYLRERLPLLSHG